MKYLSLPLVAAALLLGCASPLPIGTLGPAHEAALMREVNTNIAQGRWAEAYYQLEPALTSTDPKEAANAMSFAARHPEMLKAADDVFDPVALHALMKKRGVNVGRDLANIRLRAYRRVATQEGYAAAQANVQAAYDGFTAAEAALDRKVAEEREAERLKRKAEIDAADAKRAGEILERRKKVIEAAERARFVCRDAVDCSKAFALTQIFVSENADMKIQTANDTIIETFNPTEDMKVGIKAVRFPRAGTSAEIRLTTSCPAKANSQDLEDKMINLCLAKQERIYTQFVPFMQSNLQR